MKREFLEKLGLEKEVVDQIMAEHGRGVEANKTKVTELEGQIQTLDATVKERDGQLEGLKTVAGATDDLKAEIDKLKAENNTTKEGYEATLKELKINSAIDSELQGAKAKSLLATKALIDRSKIVVSEDGTIHGVSEQVKALVESEETKFLFGDVQTMFKGAKPPEGGDGNPIVVTDFSKLTSEERIILKQENPTQYQKLREEYLSKKGE